MSNHAGYVITASTLDGWQIDAYLGVVSAHVVAGTGLFSDFLASLSDIFGGRSGTYQRQLAGIYDDAIKLIYENAIERGANWVIGLRVDADQISGKNVQMFMVTATGTAVRASELQRRPSVDAPAPPLSSRDLANRVKKNTLVQQLASRDFALDDATWTFIIDNGVIEFAEKVLQDSAPTPGGQYPPTPSQLAKRREMFFHSLRRGDSASALYRALNTESYRTALALIIKLHLTDLDRVAQTMREPDVEIRRRALQTLRGMQYSYAPSDVQTIDNLLTLIDRSFPQQIERTKKRGLIGGEKDVWKCTCDHVNGVASTSCARCQRDLEGFLPDQLTPRAAKSLLAAQRDALIQLFRTER